MSESEVSTASAVHSGAGSDRQRFQEEIESRLVQAEARRLPVSVAVAGLDGFRLVNDSLGSELGDRVLERFQSVVAAVCGPAVRLGADTFGVVLTSMAQAAVSTAEQARAAVARSVTTPIGGTRVSLGVASYPESAASAVELLYGAEAAMYWAKAGGGDRVGYWGELVRPPDGPTWRRKGTAGDPVAALVAALERKTGVVPGQTSRSAWYARRVAKEMGVAPAEQELLHTAALLHDIGKLAIPDEVLLKAGPLTAEEKELARQHPLVGRDILGRMPSLAALAPMVAHHHEHYDGSGYPDGLQGEEIPMGSRIILVSDAFDAMTSHRAYRSVLSLQMAMQELERCGGHQFDPQVVAAFVRIVSRHGLSALHWSQGGGR